MSEFLNNFFRKKPSEKYYIVFGQEFDLKLRERAISEGSSMRQIISRSFWYYYYIQEQLHNHPGSTVAIVNKRGQIIERIQFPSQANLIK